jgi:hypothetical protein
LTVEKNAGMPENYRFMMDYEYQEKKEGNILAEMYILQIYAVYYLLDFTKFFLSLNTNSGGSPVNV